MKGLYKVRFTSPALHELESLRTPLNKGEKKVLEFFHRNLPLEWEIYIQPHLNGLRPDFVLLNPQVGIAVFEVKDWDLEAVRYRLVYANKRRPELWGTSKDGLDFRVKDNPIDKIMIYKENIANLYCPSIDCLNTDNSLGNSKNYHNLITAGAIFTSAKTEDVKQLLDPIRKIHGVLGPLEKFHPLSGVDYLESNNVEAVFPLSKVETSEEMQAQIAQELRSWLVEPDFAVTQRKPLELNKEQKRIATERTKSGFRRVKGAAGSGKSLALAARAAQLSTERKDVLVITYNITLWHYLRDLASCYPASGVTINSYITWLHFHQWCKQLICLEAGLANEYKDLWKGDSGLDKVLETEIVDLANKAIDVLGDYVRKYDAILVDEGQDFNQAWWETLKRVLKKDGEMLLAVDKTQDLYSRAKNWTEEAMVGSGFIGAWSKLNVSYRMPPTLISYLKSFAQSYLSNLDVSLPEAENTEIDYYPTHLKWVQTDQDLSKKCVQELLDLPTFTAPKVTAYPDIVLLVPSHKIGLECVLRLENKGIKVIHIFSRNKQEQQSLKLKFFMNSARVKACTVHSFKGWESRYLIVAITDDKDLASIYVALSRLKRHIEGSCLTVICSNPALKSYGQSFPIFIDNSN